MPEFFNVAPHAQALRILLDRLSPTVAWETVATVEALGRITAEVIDLPAFPRSTVDGFSLRAADTFGASEGLPRLLYSDRRGSNGAGSDGVGGRW